MLNLLAKQLDNPNYTLYHLGVEILLARFECELAPIKLKCNLCNEVLVDGSYWVAIDTILEHKYYHPKCAIEVFTESQKEFLLSHLTEISLEEL